ncbi:MAG: hypothetical protein BJ554DRAFT_4276, partial [Olpidium bornovanus]
MPAVTARTARRRPLAADGGCPRRTRIPADRPPHPYGVKPLGNLLLAGAAPDCRAPGLGTLAALTDELLLVLLADYLAPGDICRLALASRALCVLARHDELWRTLVVRRFAPSGSFRHHRTWLETYATCHLAARVGAARNFGPDAVAELQRGGLDERSSGVGAPRDVSTAAVRTVVRHVPIPVRGFYSDYLYHSHVCATLPFAPYAVAGGGNAIDRRSGLSLHDFVEEYEKPGRPVIITDVVPGWPAYAKWDREYLVANYRTTLFAAEAAELRLDDYLAYADSQRDEAPLYLFDKHFGERCPGLAEEFEVPVYFREDLFRHLGSERPDYRWLIIGPERSGSTFHKALRLTGDILRRDQIPTLPRPGTESFEDQRLFNSRAVDPYTTDATSAYICGKRRRGRNGSCFRQTSFLPAFSPMTTNRTRSIVKPIQVTSPVNLAEWFVNFYEVMKSCWTGRRQPLEGVCRSGELMFVPAGWWHAVINLEFSVA